MNIAVIPAAGSGSRFGGAVPKQFLEIAGVPIIIHTMLKFDACDDIDAIITALSPHDIEPFSHRIKSFDFQKPIHIVGGGAERSESILNALEVARAMNPEIVAVHDAVRPFITPQLISKVISRARITGAAICGLSSVDTLKEVENDVIVRTIDRKRIYRAQTPQAFSYDLLMRANNELINGAIPSVVATDDSFLVEQLGVQVEIVEGSPDNIKITTPEDFIFAERMIEKTYERKEMKSRIGIGNDIHKLVEGRNLILGGVEIPFERGLLGHSDGDSLSHAITDALLGACGLGDIGTHFSDKDPKWKKANSDIFLQHARDAAEKLGYTIANVDATILAEQPKMRPYIDAMRERLAGLLNIDESQINIKAKTNEGFDAIGKSEAIGAQAVVLLVEK